MVNPEMLCTNISCMLEMKKTQKYIQVYRCKNTQSRNVLYIDSKIADICVDSQRANSDTPIKNSLKNRFLGHKLCYLASEDTHTHTHTRK